MYGIPNQMAILQVYKLKVKLTATLQVQKVKGRTYNYFVGTKGQIGSIPGSNFTMKVIVQKLTELLILAS